MCVVWIPILDLLVVISLFSNVVVVVVVVVVRTTILCIALCFGWLHNYPIYYCAVHWVIAEWHFFSRIINHQSSDRSAIAVMVGVSWFRDIFFVVAVGAMTHACRVYLCSSGGIDMFEFLKSRCSPTESLETFREWSVRDKQIARLERSRKIFVECSR